MPPGPSYDERLAVPLRWWALATMFWASVLLAFLVSTPAWVALGATVVLKFENHQFTASFKERGALNTLLSLTSDERAGGVVAASAGNHAQGVAYAARALGTSAGTAIAPAATAPSRGR